MQNLPPSFLDGLRPLLGAELEAFLASFAEAPALALRVHRAGPAALRFAAAPVPWARDGFYLRAETRPGASVEHWAGAFYLQEASAMLPAAVLNARPGERVLDLCAAPGGKATQIARALGGEGLLVLNEPEPARAHVLAGNLERLGVLNAMVVCESPARLASAWPEAFDAVLVDAPCSGEGMFRRDPDARGQWSSAAPRGCAHRQAEILAAAADLVRPGGRLVYSTCTFNALENERTVAAFLDARRDFSPWDFTASGLGASQEGMLRVWPHRARGDGQFCARLRRAGIASAAPGGEPNPAKPPKRPSAKARDCGCEGDPRALLAALLQTAVRALPAPLAGAPLRAYGARLYAVPALAPDAAGLRVVSPGTALLRIEKNRVEPEHALAMALFPGQALREAALTREQAVAFLAGQTLARTGEPGWTLAGFEGLPLGWGKQSGEQLKNHLPKGLRRNLRI